MRKTLETNRDWQGHWTSVGKRTGRDELFRQVERTIGGKPEPADQVDILVRAIAQHLQLNVGDVLLDLCCGNGLITARLAALCQAVIGVDYSLELIETARERHAAANTIYLHRMADDLKDTDFLKGSPSKVCMNAGLQYFTEPMTKRLLLSLRALEQPNLAFYITDIPDAGKIDAFYNTPERRAEFEHRRLAGTEAVGTWWDRNHLIGLAAAAGFSAKIIEQDSRRATAHYRFDVLATLTN
jgi:SAM-dependent methyltransferase